MPMAANSPTLTLNATHTYKNSLISPDHYLFGKLFKLSRRAEGTYRPTHTHFRVDIGKSRKHAEKNGWPEGRQACDGMKMKNKLRQARRTRIPLQHAARTGAARTEAGCREEFLRPTQRRLGRPAVEHENGRPTEKQQFRTRLRATIEQVT